MMKKVIGFSVFMLCSYYSFAQSRVKIYLNSNGDIYNQARFDSISSIPGWSISRIDSRDVPDTTFINIKIEKAVVDEVIVNNEGKPMPDFSFSDLQGKQYNIRDLRGFILHFNFWGTNCSPCIVEMPDLSRLKELYQDRKVLFFGVAAAPSGELKQFLKKHAFNFIIVSNKEMFTRLGIDSYPVNFFVDRKGVVRKVKTGTPLKKNMENGKWEVDLIGNYTKIINSLD